ncbi:MAG: restriction endonuclease subunit S [Lachnospiraceae bacterium]|nr:restriction endonuclease subunit S [Lachnospiraceae bacterium]
MAKKGQELTLEEKLEQALVPAEEQPYEVPENWCWVRLGDLYNINPKTEADDEMPAAFIPMEKIEAGLINSYTYDIQEWAKAKKGHTRFQDGDVAFAKISPCFENRKSMILNSLPSGVGGGTTELIVLRSKVVLPRFTFWLVSTEDFIIGGKQTYSGTVGQQRISMDYVKKYHVPLPPLAEQQRIVDRIESLFAKLDEAKEKIQNVLDESENRKNAILHKAFTGELTQKWRMKHGVELASWELKRISDVTRPRAGYAFDSKKFTNQGYQVIRMGNLYGENLDLSRSPVFIAQEDVNEDVLERALIHSGDILITLTGTKYKRDYGYAVQIIGESKLLVNQRILCLSPLENIESEYLLYYLHSDVFRDIFFSNETGGVNQGNVSSKFVEGIEINLPCKDEQRVIASMLNMLMDKEKNIIELATDVIKNVDIIKKSILAKAFRGELGTNDSSDESAIELLKNVLEA